MTDEELAERERKLAALRAYLEVGHVQAQRGEFAELPSVKDIMARARARMQARIERDAEPKGE